MRQNDVKILQHIRQNARTNLTTISRKTGIPVSTIFDRLRAHEGQLIHKFTALLDFKELGFPISAKIFLKTDPQHRKNVRNYLLAHTRVNSIWRVNNGFDFASDCVFATIKEAEEFTEELEMRFNILDRHVFHVIDTIAMEKIMTEIPNL